MNEIFERQKQIAQEIYKRGNQTEIQTMLWGLET